MKFSSYECESFFDEMFLPDGTPRAGTRLVKELIESLPDGDLLARQAAAERLLLQNGITFNVYSDNAATEKIFPFDIIPRVVEAAEWEWIESGLKQRVYALNLFIDDIYHQRKIVKDKIVPDYLIESARSFRKECIGLNPPQGVWCHITGTDLVRDRDGQMYVLEDNLRCPSGVSYVLENRRIMKRTLPQAFDASRVRPVDEYPSRLLATLQSLFPAAMDSPKVAVLTPGIYNSAYYEHSFLAQQMGVELVEGRDLVAVNNRVMMRTTKGLEPVDVLYRRIDDDFIDPQVFRPDSLLGVPGLMEIYKKGRVALANAPGTGIADDKSIYAYVPKIIEYYMGEKIIIPNVPTHICAEPKELQYVVENLDKLVVKAVNESGGYGMLVGPHSTTEERGEFARRIHENPRNYIAQPTLGLSRVPVIANGRVAGRHVDLRPYILYGADF
jgi:uncharacterized circularly permuted ATP-grasp superfamily protein